MIVGTHLKPKNGMVSLNCNMAGGASSASSSHIAIHNTAAKIKLPVRKYCCSVLQLLNVAHKWTLIQGTDNNGKDLLTNRKDPWAEFKELKLS